MGQAKSAPFFRETILVPTNSRKQLKPVMLRTLEEKVDPKNAALLIVDMQKDYCSESGAFATVGFDISMTRNMIPRLARLLTEARNSRVPAIYTRSIYNTDPNWYLSDVWLEHKARRQRGIYVSTPALRAGSWGAEFVDEVKPKPEDLIVTKHRYSAFYGTDLEVALRARGIKSLIMTGVSTNVCVESTARDAFFRDFYVVFTSDCTATNNGGEEAHNAALQNIDRCFGIVTTSTQIMECWKKSEIRVSAPIPQ
ncbi:MAG: cysteine hydrolase family protein [Nitrososphaerales archaeon]